ncbi:MAG: PAS domain S-box protein [Ferruginibacter sp.]
MKPKKSLAFDVTFFITILLLVLASALSYRYINSLKKSSNLVNHTNLVKLELEQTLSYVKDAETSQRGFLLSNDPAFLEPVAEAMSKTVNSIGQVERLTMDNPAQRENTRMLSSLINKRFERLKYNVSLKSRGLPNDTTFSEGMNIMNRLRSVVNNMMNIEETLLRQREKDRDRFEILTPLYSLLFSIIAILVVSFVYWRLRKENQLRTKAETGEAIIHNFFQQVPAMLAILKGSEHRFVFANQPYIELIGNRDIIGKAFREVLPEMESTDIFEQLDNVYATGTSYSGKETAVTLQPNDRSEKVYINFTYQPYVGTSGETEGIMIFCYDVSEMFINRKKTEDVEQRSRIAIEATKMGVFDWDLQHDIFISSPRLFEIFGFKDHTEATHKDLLSRFHPEDKLVRDKAVIESLKEGSLIYEARLIWPDNTVHWINVYGKVIYDEQKLPLRMYGSVIDVTDKRKVVEELKESESKFRLLAGSLKQQVWTTDAKGKMNYFNQTVYDYSDVSGADPERIGWMNTIHPDEKHDNLKKWSNAVTNGQEFISEHRLLNQHGEYRWHISLAVPQLDENGSIRMWVGTSTDVQEQKNFSEELEKKVKERTDKLFEKNLELKQSEDRYYSMVNEVQDYAILLLNAEGNIQNWNKGAEKIKGYKADEIIGKNFKIFYQQQDRETKLPERLLAMAIEKGKAENLGWRVRSDGSRFWASVVITALHDDQKNVVGFSKVTRDLTDRKNAEERQLEYLQNIEQKNIKLEQSNAELESFNYIASHDLQEPLRKIQAFSQLIMEKEKSNLSQMATDYFSRINKAASNMQNLIEALISYSQTNSAGIQLAETDLNNLLEDVKNDLSNVLEEKHTVIDADVLPIVQADPIQFRQLFTNLISNAVKYSKPGIPPHIIITVTLMKGKDVGEPDAIPEWGYWKISIMDNGIGFDQKYANKIFELFQRLHGKLEYQGTGIGLAICKKIMRNHEGCISATGNPQEGSVFNIFLPLKNKFLNLQ